MKIAISSMGRDLDAHIDPRFGRCAYFVIVDTDDMSFEAFDNENIALGGGAGIQAAQFVASKGANVVITGNCGPNAVRTLSAAGVEVIVGQKGTIRETVDNYKEGNLESTIEPNVSDHYGMGGDTTMDASPPQSPGFGKSIDRKAGCGGGMGRGLGRGRCMGGGMGASRSAPSKPSESVPLSRAEELKRLKEQAAELQSRIQVIESDIGNSGKQ